MREFDHPNMTGFCCPICKTSFDAPVVLAAIPGTEDGNLVECEQVHSECFKLVAKMRGVNHGIEQWEVG